MSKKQIIYSIVALIVVLVAGAFWGAQKYAPGFIGGQIFRAEPVTTNSTPVTSTPSAVYTISGTVKSVSAKQISFELSPLDVRIAKINDTTNIMRVSPKDPEEIKREAEEFMKFMQDPRGTPPLPTAPVEVVAVLSDIKVGDTIIVTTAENSENLKEFVAVNVRILPR